MTRKTYQSKLEELRGEVTSMADLTLERFEDAIVVLGSGNGQLAEQIITGDQELNDWYLDIESDCIELIALQQPVASDLRFIASSFKIVTDLERIGDLATNLAAYGREGEGDIFASVDVIPIANTAGEMVADAMTAYEQEDTELARAVAGRDDALDDECRQATEAVMRDVLTVETRSDEIEGKLEAVSRALLTIRDLERVGDHAVNICARTVYMLENDDELIY